MDNTIPMLIFAGFLWYLVYKMSERNSKAESKEKKPEKVVTKEQPSKEYIDAVKAREYMRGFRDGMDTVKKSDDPIDVEYEVVEDTRLSKRR